MKSKVVLLTIIGLVLLTSGCSVKKVDELTDAERFAKEYNISTENPFKYIETEELLSLLEKGTGIVFFANSDDEGSIKATKYINEVAKSNKIQKIYYYNPIVDNNQEKKSKKIKKYLDKYQNDDDFIVPDLYAIRNGNIINHSNCFSTKKELSEDYLTKKRLKKIKQKYSEVLNYEEYVD